MYLVNICRGTQTENAWLQVKNATFSEWFNGTAISPFHFFLPRRCRRDMPWTHQCPRSVSSSRPPVMWHLRCQVQQKWQHLQETRLNEFACEMCFRSHNKCARRNSYGWYGKYSAITLKIVMCIIPLITKVRYFLTMACIIWNNNKEACLGKIG